ncbi:MAG: adenylate/guanylate cyclase domain-containing protein, partial [Polyangiaceae bacterium]
MSEREKLERAIAALEAQSSALGQSVVETATAELRQKLASLATLSSDRRRLVSVLFADVSGFTALSERLDPDDVQSLLTRLWRRLDRAITTHRGRIDKHIGDAVMAVWGLDETRSDDAENAVRSALALQAELEQFRRAEQVSLGMRVGVNSGLASLSRVESTGEANLIGDAVNLASRLEHAAEVGSVLIGHSTHDQVRDRFELAELPPFPVKGKAEPVRAWRALRELPRATRLPTRTLTGGLTQTVGRDRELGLLLAEYQRARGGQLSVVTFSGEAGVGKSRLLADFDRLLLMQSDPLQLLRVPCWPDDAQTAFRTLGRLVERFARAPEGASPAEVLARLPNELEATLGADEAREASALLGRLVGLGATETVLDDPAQARGRAKVLLKKHLEKLSTQRVAVVELDDLHFADADSTVFLGEVLGELGRCALLVVATARPEATLGRLPGQELALAPLAPEASAELLRQLLGRLAPPPTWLIEQLTQKSGGNPHFLEELVRWLIDCGAIDTSVEPWSVDRRRLDDAPVPSLLEAALAQRLERLSDDARQLLSQAAVLGPTFWQGGLEAIAGGRVDEESLALLQDADLIVKSPISRLTGETELAFRHLLLRDVTYQYTLLRERRVYHRRAGDWLAARADADPAAVAGHYEAAGEARLAAGWYASAAEQARARGAPQAAIPAYDSALSLSGGADAALSARCLEGLGDALRQHGRYAEALARYEELRSTAAVLADARLGARAHNRASFCHAQQGGFDAALAAAERAEAMIRSSSRAVGALGPGELKELANALVNRAWAELMLGRRVAAEAAARQALGMTEGQLDAERALAHNVLGVACYHLDSRFDEAARHLEQALALQRKRGDRWGIACQLNNLGDLARVRGDHRMAVALAEESLAVARE